MLCKLEKYKISPHKAYCFVCLFIIIPQLFVAFARNWCFCSSLLCRLDLRTLRHVYICLRSKFPNFSTRTALPSRTFCTCCCVIMLNPIILTKSHASPSQIIVFVCLSFFRSIVNSVSRITHIITSHGENGSRPQMPLYPRKWQSTLQNIIL